MSLFRSAPMKYYQLYIPKEETYNVVSKLAPHNFVQFLDGAANNFHKPYYHSIKRCQEVIHKIDIILKQVRKYNIQLPQIPIVQKVLEKHEQIIKDRKINELAILDQIEDQIESKYTNLDQLIRSLTISQKQIIDLEDYKYLLFKAREIFGSKKDDDNEDGVDFSKTTLQQLRLVNASGIIFSKDLLKFSKMVFRATKGNCIIYTFNIPNDFPKVDPRTAFIIILESGSNVLTKVIRICQTFYAKKYALPTNKEQIFQKIKEIQDTINDTKQLAAMTQKRLRQDLNNAISSSDYGYSKFESYRILIEKQSMIFHAMNKLQERFNSAIAKIWVPQQKRGLLLKLVPALVTIRDPQTEEKAPTYFEMNQFTAPFQQIINTYGVPRYQEVNPALFAIPIFPFLFGVMFGDIGHGGVVLAFAIWTVISKDAKSFLPPGVYSIRYLLLMMGGFAFYSGWIYNQFFSIPLNLFGSCYGHAQHEQEAQKIQHCVYPIGFDPKWIRSSNELNFFNSYKMKFAVIIGVAQMTFAIFLKALNSLHFKNYVDFFCEWLPQQIFFACTFGYMCILIIFKWTIPWGEQRLTSEAPSLIAQMIALPLKMGSTEGKPLWDIEAQQSLQYNLLMMSLICVPWMLIFKPLILWWKMPSAHPHEQHDLDEHLRQPLSQDRDFHKNQKTRQESKVHSSHDEHDISEIAVHQIIQTIEFVLGSISNTASYLRLWALSLAHGQLSKVFLEKTIGGGIASANTLIIAIGMYFFLNISLGVIMLMDTMQCFLHALRLQWVEFDSKFFKADGIKFNPLSLQGPLQQNAIKLRDVEE